MKKELGMPCVKLKDLDLSICKEYGFCLLCGRKLKNSKSKELGYGKRCFEKHKKKASKSLF